MRAVPQNIRGTRGRWRGLGGGDRVAAVVSCGNDELDLMRPQPVVSRWEPAVAGPILDPSPDRRWAGS